MMTTLLRNMMNPLSIRTTPTLLALLVLLLPAVAVAEPPEAFRDHPGFVDGKPFRALAGEKDGLVEVNISGALLRLAGAAFKSEEPELYRFLTGIQSIHAVVVNQSDDTRAVATLHSMTGSLDRRGWERIAFVRDDDELIHVYVHSGDDVLDGLTVLVHHPGVETIFANIAGDIDMALLADLGDRIQIPGLNHLGGGSLTGAGVYSVPAPKASPGDGDAADVESPAPRADSREY
jgi:hypothetical protein